MHCNICDRQLSEKEISWNEDLQTFEPCTTCLDIAFEAAYSGSFKADEDDDKYILLEDDDEYDTGLNGNDYSWMTVHDD